MQTEFTDERLMARYLLGEMSEQEQSQMIDRYFDDYAFLEQMMAVENDLVDDYLGDRLSQRERERFEQHFLATPKRREKVELARMIKRALAPVPDTPSFVTRISMKLVSSWSSLLGQTNNPVAVWTVAIALVIVIGGVWLFSPRHRLTQPQQDQIAYGREGDRGTPTPASNQSPTLPENSGNPLKQSASARDKPPSPKHAAKSVLASIMLAPSLRTGGMTQTLTIESGTSAVQIVVFIEKDDYPLYQVTVETSERVRITHLEKLRPHLLKEGKAIVVTVPATRLKDDDYLLILRGITAKKSVEEIDSRVFRVIRK